MYETHISYDQNKKCIFLQELTEQNKNVFVSPASIKATLAMVLEGAYGKCAEEIRNVLRLQLDKQESRNKLQRLLYDLRVG